MQILVIATGKCRDKAVNALSDEFIKRLKPFLTTKVIELPQAKAQTADEIKRKEGEAQLAKVPANSFIIALDEKGKEFTTRQFANLLKEKQNAGIRTAVFIIGGAEGLSDAVKQQAHQTISLSQLTFPHMLVKPILLEQIYRAGTLIVGHPYHRD